MTRWQRKVGLLIITFCASTSLGSGLKLNDDGGYEITVALEDMPVSNIGVSINRYIDNMEISFNAFSSLLWTATKSRFYLKSVNVLIPSNWTTDKSSTATTESYETADIRLSSRVIHPRVDNPNLCGQPGNYIELPDHFFNVTNSGPYGPHRKSLLHTWAIYRFGVHPEHGFVGDSKYPYAEKDVHSQQWKATGCSNEDIKGQFVDITDPNENCETENGLSSNCRFVPSSAGQSATTSLMHFHWIDSITEFCDEHTHDKFSQNKQNALCDYKSVWEVLRESQDYLAVKTPREDVVPPLTFKVVKHSSAPLFYVLLDRGRIQAPLSIAVQVPPLLASIFDEKLLRNTVAAIGAFPGTSDDSYIQDLVDWSEIEQNSNTFHDTVGSLKANGPLERDFSKALKEVAEKIKRKNHPSGAVVLLVKYGADLRNFGSYLPESEVVHAFNEAHTIFNAIELAFDDHTTGYSHLAGIAKGTGGSFTVLKNAGEVVTSVKNVLGYVNRTLITEYSDLWKNYKILSKDSLASTSNIPIPNDLTGPVQIFLSTFNANLTSSNIQIIGYSFSDGANPRELPFTFAKSLDWNQAGSKLTYRLDVKNSELNDINQIRMRILCPSGDCSSNILTRAEFSKDAHNVTIHVSTSVEDGKADLSSGRPVSIFAKVTKNGLPVRDAVVVAALTEALSSKTERIRLVDNGDATPDVEELDGVYSGYFAPEDDGQYKLSVTVEGIPSLLLRKKRSVKKTTDENAFIRLLPIDQSDTGCGTSCDPETIDGSFSQTVEYPIALTISNAWNYKPQPSKIDITAIVDRPDLGQLILYWRPPSIPGRPHLSASSYILRSALTRESLISDFENQTEIPIPPNFRPGPPTSLETFLVSRPSVTTYYALRSIYAGKQSALSNIESVIISTSTITPTPSTPSTETTSTSTNPTTSGGSTVSTTSTSGGPPVTGSPTSSQPPTGSTTTPQSGGETTTTEDGSAETTTAMGYKVMPPATSYSIFIVFMIFAYTL